MNKDLKYIILLFTIWLIAWGVSAQCNQSYKSFDKFSNDTTTFLRYNFKTRADCYKGKTVAYVLNDLQLKPKSYFALYSTQKDKYQGICIFLNDDVYISSTKAKQYIYILERIDG